MNRGHGVPPTRLGCPVREVCGVIPGLRLLARGEQRLPRRCRWGYDALHMDIAAPVKSMSVAKRLIKDLRAGNEKAARKLIIGPPVAFAGPRSHKAYQQETITATPGMYVQVCFMETPDGRDHALLSMERIIRITK